MKQNAFNNLNDMMSLYFSELNIKLCNKFIQITTGKKKFLKNLKNKDEDAYCRKDERLSQDRKKLPMYCVRDLSFLFLLDL